MILRNSIHNPIYNTDWLDLARSLVPASIDLLYADPPFNTGITQSSHAGSYADTWPATGDWVAWLRERLVATLPAIKDTGLLLLHVDWRTSHRARLLLDELLGEDHFVNHLIWQYGLGGSSPRRFARKHDDILLYCINPRTYHFTPPMVPATSRRMKGQMKKATDVIDVPSINNMSTERVGYPTQKPVALLSMLISACCPLNGTVLDPVCGSGTTGVAAKQLGRMWILGDISPNAVAIARTRLDTGRTHTIYIEPKPAPTVCGAEHPA